MSVEVHTVDQVAEQLHVHPQTVRIWIRKGLLGHVRISRRILITDDQLEIFVNAHRHDADQWYIHDFRRDGRPDEVTGRPFDKHLTRRHLP